MNTHVSNAPEDADAEIADIATCLCTVSSRLHGIPSRSDPQEITREVMRLNDAVKHIAHSQPPLFTSHADFPATLLQLADIYPDGNHDNT